MFYFVLFLGEKKNTFEGKGLIYKRKNNKAG